MRLRFTPRSTANLIEIADKIHVHNPMAAKRVQADVHNGFEKVRAALAPCGVQSHWATTKDPNPEEGNMRSFAPNTVASSIVATGLLGLAIIGLTAGNLASQPAPKREVTAAEYEGWKKSLSNWGRWGADDQIGAMNLITPAKRKEAATLVKEGFSVSLASDADTVKAVDNPFPYEHDMLAIGNHR